MKKVGIAVFFFAIVLRSASAAIVDDFANILEDPQVIGLIPTGQAGIEIKPAATDGPAKDDEILLNVKYRQLYRNIKTQAGILAVLGQLPKGYFANDPRASAELRNNLPSLEPITASEAARIKKILAEKNAHEVTLAYNQTVERKEELAEYFEFENKMLEALTHPLSADERAILMRIKYDPNLLAAAKTYVEASTAAREAQSKSNTAINEADHKDEAKMKELFAARDRMDIEEERVYSEEFEKYLKVLEQTPLTDDARAWIARKREQLKFNYEYEKKIRAPKKTIEGDEQEALWKKKLHLEEEMSYVGTAFTLRLEHFIEQYAQAVPESGSEQDQTVTPDFEILNDAFRADRARFLATANEAELKALLNGLIYESDEIEISRESPMTREEALKIAAAKEQEYQDIADVKKAELVRVFHRLRIDGAVKFDANGLIPGLPFPEIKDSGGTLAGEGQIRVSIKVDEDQKPHYKILSYDNFEWKFEGLSGKSMDWSKGVNDRIAENILRAVSAIKVEVK